MKRIYILFYLFLVVILSGCSPKSITTESENIDNSSLSWIPYEGEEEIVYLLDTARMVFYGSGKISYYETVRYMTDQGGFLGWQEDYYADLERQQITFSSVSTPYFIKYYHEHNKGDVGSWDILRVSVGDGDYYKNEMKIVTYETEKSDKGENYIYKNQIVLQGIQFDSVYLRTQEQRPFELYYTKSQGVVAFKVSSSELWVLRQDTIN